MKLYTVNAGYFKLDGGAMFGVVPKSLWNKLNPADEHNMCTWALRCLLVETEDRLILIDTGIGNKQDAKFFAHYYLHGDDSLAKSLAVHGFSQADITDVFLTHLHFDHCGGSIIREGDQLISAFPNAVFWSNHLHWDWAVNPNAREKASFLKENIIPMEPKLRMVDVSGASGILPEVPFLPGFSVRIAGGHTRAMMLPQLTVGGRTILYMADLLPSAAHIPIPYVMAYDMFPLETLEEKRSILEEAVADEYLLYLEHDPLLECCTLQRGEKGIRIGRSGKLRDLL